MHFFLDFRLPRRTCLYSPQRQVCRAGQAKLPRLPDEYAIMASRGRVLWAGEFLVPHPEALGRLRESEGSSPQSPIGGAGR